MAWKIIEQAVAVLRENGHALLADAVVRLAESEQQARRASETTLQAYYDLKERHEPTPRSPDCWKNNWTGD